MPESNGLDAFPETTDLPELLSVRFLTKAIRTAVGPKQERSVVDARGGSSNILHIALVPPGLPEHVGELVRSSVRRERETRRVKVLPCLWGSLLVTRASEENEAVAFSLEGVHIMPAVAVEKQQVVLDVDLDFVLRLQILKRAILVVGGPIIQFPTGEVAESLDEGRPDVVAIAVQPASIVFVDVDRRVHELLGELRRHSLPQPAGEELRELRITLRTDSQ
mmetsp:Transcript_122484/g.346348  ORF Transcript_122484/g.346348 Transcript_122484/m.346348 type:complete len:221 (-) Transcript_122484:761-1423(-)